MSQKISSRLLEIIGALPIKDGMRILEIGCGPGVAAREIVRRFEKCYMLAIDRSAKAMQQSIQGSAAEIKSGRLRFLQTAIEDFVLPAGEEKFDLVFAIRVGALDGRHPELEKEAFFSIAKALKSGGKFFIDGGDPIREVKL